MDTNSVMRRGRNERVYGCAWPCAGPALGRRNGGTVDENFAPGKNPCAHRPGFVRSHVLGAPIAQLDRASDYGSEGYRFNSYWVRQLQASEHQAVLLLGRDTHKTMQNVLGQFLANFQNVALH